MLSNIYALLISVVLTFATVVIHYEFLVTRWPVRNQLISVRIGMLRLLIAIFAAHIIEIILYAVAFYLMHGHLGLGTLTGEMTGRPRSMNRAWLRTHSWVAITSGLRWRSVAARLCLRCSQ